MSKTTRVVIALADLEKRVALKKLLFADEMIEMVGEVTKGDDCRALVKEQKPDVLIIGQKLEDIPGMDLITALGIETPDLSCIYYLEGEAGDDRAKSEMMREAMVAGARDCLFLPIEPDVTLRMIKRVGEITRKKREVMAALAGGEAGGVHTCRIVTVFSTKGGVGRSLIAVNLAVALAHKSGHKVCLVDLNLQFGDCAIMLDLKPTRTITTLVQEIDAGGTELDDKTLAKYLLPHEEGRIDVLAAPLKPEDSELITADHINKVLKALSDRYHYIVIDTPSNLNDVLLTALDQSELILLLLTMELPTIKSGKLMIEVMESLKFPKEKIRLVMNRETAKAELNAKEIEEALKFPIVAVLPSDGKAALPSINTGRPFFLAQPDTPLAKAVDALAQTVMGNDEPATVVSAGPKKKAWQFWKK